MIILLESYYTWDIIYNLYLNDKLSSKSCLRDDLIIGIVFIINESPDLKKFIYLLEGWTSSHGINIKFVKIK